MKIKVGDLTRRQILKICDKSTVGSIHCSKTCPLYRANNICLCGAVDDKDLAIEIDLETEENSNEEYWLDKMNKNPRYREIWEKIKEQPFHQTTEMILELESKLEEVFTKEDVEGLIKDREETIKVLKFELAERDESIKYLQGIKRYDIGQLLTENIRLKQSQKETAIAKLEDVKNFCQNSDGFNEHGQSIRVESVVDYINCQIQELQGRLQK